MVFPPQRGFLPEASPERFAPPLSNGLQGKPPIMAFADNLIICILLVGAGTTVKLMSKWLHEESLRKDAEKEQLKTSLALLRHQVSPHFFMNTLNNIHALVEIDSGKAQDAIERLSILMRYLLYDSAQSTIELKEEIEFINSFVSLMQLRHSDEVEIKILIPNQIPDIKIPPMLFISLLENAFKHGVSYPLKSYIYLEMQIHESSLVCTIKNSKHKTVANQFDEYSGIGLENIKKSLNLLYEQDYKLDISDQANEFEVNLTIPV
jgi:LytS/YehU family sensor histidine kinase